MSEQHLVSDFWVMYILIVTGGGLATNQSKISGYHTAQSNLTVCLLKNVCTFSLHLAPIRYGRSISSVLISCRVGDEQLNL